MSCWYGLQITITELNPNRKTAIKKACRAEWKGFKDWDTDSDGITCCGEDYLPRDQDEEEFAKRLAQAVFKANGGECGVVVEVTDLNISPPTNTYEFGVGSEETTEEVLVRIRDAERAAHDGSTATPSQVTES